VSGNDSWFLTPASAALLTARAFVGIHDATSLEFGNLDQADKPLSFNGG